MPISKNLTAEFEEGLFYHVICSSVGNECLFASEDDNLFFLRRFKEYLTPYIDTFAYCLLSNHAHFLIRPKSLAEIVKFLEVQEKHELTPTLRLFMRTIDKASMFHELIEQQFHRLYISYARTYNKKQERKGNLFRRPFKRILIDDNSHLIHLVVYIHANPVKHQLTEDFIGWKWSSYRSYLTNSPSALNKSELLIWFGGKEKFIKTHLAQSRHYYTHQLAGE